MGIRCSNELVFCRGEEVLNCIDDTNDTNGEITVVHDEVMGLLEEFLQHVQRLKLSAHLRPAQNHRNLVLTAVKRNGKALRHASADLKADQDVVLAAVRNDAHALRYASAKLQADQDFAMKAVACNSQALLYLSERLRGDPGVRMALQNLPDTWPATMSNLDLCTGSAGYAAQQLELATTRTASGAC
jgi:hypothetical protein